MNENFQIAINLLLPHCGTAREREALLRRAFFDYPTILSKIDYSGQPYDFAVLLITTLKTYGALNHGQQALWMLFTVLKSEVGLENKRIIDSLEGWANSFSNSSEVSVQQAYKSKIFISYKHIEPDERIAQEIFRSLNKQFDVFIDQSIEVGQNWARKIRAEIAVSDFFIILLSQDSIYSQMVQEEAILAAQLQAHTGSPILLPIRLAYRGTLGHTLNGILNSIQWLMWNGPQDTLAIIENLHKAVSQKSHFSQQNIALEISDHQTTSFAPLPQADLSDLESPGGAMKAQSRFYIERPEDAIALRATQGQESFTLTINAPRQMGKSSLLSRIIHNTQEKKQIIYIDFQLFEQQALLRDGPRFFKAFTGFIADELGLESEFESHWTSRYTELYVFGCHYFFARHVLPKAKMPLILAMDEVDVLIDSEFRSEFFGMLRSWHNARASKPIWSKLSMALVISTEPMQLISNPNMSPFNVSLPINLNNFTVSHVEKLNMLHIAEGFPPPLAPSQIAPFMELLGGQPYLVRRALHLLAHRQLTVSALFDTAASSMGPFGDHLRYHLFRLQKHPELVQGMKQVLSDQTCDENVYMRLNSAGLVAKGDQRQIKPRNRLYADYFEENLRE